MDIQVKLYGIFQQYAPQERQEFRLELPPGATVDALLKTLRIPFDQDRVILVNGRQSEPEKMLAPGDMIAIFSPMCGG